ncbi:MAG TPA: hypothetical protein VHS80_01425 [Chthoniobacterales bacterium]|nr:hypothetical protein [Chthoniobacterales bacterium]
MHFPLGRLPFTVIIHRNGIVNANVCAVKTGGNINGGNISGENTSGENNNGVIITIIILTKTEQIREH